MIRTMNDVRELEARSERHETPCGDGAMVWRRWSNPDAQPVVLLHGGSGSWLHWVRTIPALRTRYDVWTADLPGLGDSAMPAQPYTPQSSATAVAAGLKALIPAERRPQLVGFSFGAHVGTFAAGLLGDHIATFTITGTSALGIVRPPMPEFPKERSTMSDEERRAVHHRVLEILMISRPERIDDLAVSLQQINVNKARFRSRKFAPTDNVRTGLANVKVPLRTAWGRNDVIAHPNVEACIDILREHHPELVAEIVDDAGHWVMFEQAEGYNAALMRLLALPA